MTKKIIQKLLPEQPGWSQRLYLALAKKDIAFFRFLLESEDNLAYMSVVDRYESVLKLTFAPGQRQEVLDFIMGLQAEMQLRLMPLPPGLGPELCLQTSKDMSRNTRPD